MEVCDACEYYYKKEDIIVMDNGSCLCIHCHWVIHVYEEDEYEDHWAIHVYEEDEYEEE